MNTYYEIDCPCCNNSNLINNGDLSDQTRSDVTSFKCWLCGKIIKLPDYLEDNKSVREYTEADSDQDEWRENGLNPNLLK